MIFASTPMFATFVAASFVLAITPGPGVLYIVTRSATQGRAAGLASVAGIALGNLGNATAASLGLAAIFAISSVAFTAVKYMGAAYLIWLGIQAFRSGATALKRAASGSAGGRALSAVALRRIFTDGFLVALFNPKTALFFAAFLPQFLPASAGALQTVAMGAIFVLIAVCTDTCYALASGAVGPWLSRGNAAAGIGRTISGSVFI
ncbi:MAG: LysE family translocator, partial [Burkholderiaceae bacterium]|nr:LysE family translocator [Burkholderiaceae bacterium]